jgi:hypothetical protein
MKQIKLNERVILVDDEDYPRVKHFSLKFDKDGYVRARVWGHDGYRSIKDDVSLHRFIMRCYDDRVVHHCNGNKLDNCKSNLKVMRVEDHNALLKGMSSLPAYPEDYDKVKEYAEMNGLRLADQLHRMIETYIPLTLLPSPTPPYDY